jgi:hypothetical protein
VAAPAGQIAEAFTKARNSALAAQTLARDLRSVLHGQPDGEPIVATVDLSKLDLEQESGIMSDGTLE